MSCSTRYCLRDTKGCKFCSTCRSRKTRAKNYILHLYYNIKHRAKARGVVFNLSMGYWFQFCNETSYHLLVGTGAEDMTVDRKDVLRGYEDDNIQMLTNRENIQKRNADRKAVNAAYNPVDVPF